MATAIVSISIADLEGVKALMDEAAAHIKRLTDLLELLTDPGDCWFDHHGGCQEHGYLGLQPGEVCPVRQAQDILDEQRPGWRLP